MTSPSIGSSPLARGLQLADVGLVALLGIIPARAGFTSWILIMTGIRRDHPRSRGVYLMPVFMLSKAVGSSPLARGLHGERAGDDLARGIIPARAGFTLPPTPTAPRRADHPRSRGVYTVRASRDCSAGGSSPLARGLRPVIRMMMRPCRIIPARAGFTGLQKSRSNIVKDHPRSRGVYSGAVMARQPSSGSSPLARGLRSRSGDVEHNVGIIPARAGFT